jgi:hypothetical protein
VHFGEGAAEAYRYAGASPACTHASVNEAA